MLSQDTAIENAGLYGSINVMWLTWRNKIRDTEKHMASILVHVVLAENYVHLYDREKVHWLSILVSQHNIVSHTLILNENFLKKNIVSHTLRVFKGRHIFISELARGY